jgi:hypothetical protein
VAPAVAELKELEADSTFVGATAHASCDGRDPAQVYIENNLFAPTFSALLVFHVTASIALTLLGVATVSTLRA